MNKEQFVNEVKGKFFRIGFIKKDGTLREMTARLGVKKYLKGGDKRELSDNYLTVYDMEKRSYRTVNFKELVYLKYNGKKVIGENALLKVIQ